MSKDLSIQLLQPCILDSDFHLLEPDKSKAFVRSKCKSQVGCQGPITQLLELKHKKEDFSVKVPFTESRTKSQI